MNITVKQIVSDLINQPGLGMFAWFCLISFLVAFVFFVWALKSGQMNDLEESKFDMLDDTTQNGEKHA